MFKKNKGDSDADAVANFNKMYGFDSPHQHERTISQHKDNFHVNMVQTVLRVTKAEKVMHVFNDLIKPLPDWSQALFSTLFISIVPIFIIYLLNVLFLSRPSLRDSVIYYLISFAIGGLLGDVFFHTLPHLGESGHHDHGHHDHHDHSGHGHSHDPQQMVTNMIIIAGIVSFFLIEKMVEKYLGTGGDCGHNHSHQSEKVETTKKAESGSAKKRPTLAEEKAAAEKKAKGVPEVSAEKELRYKSYAIMTLIGDFLHNFTDGLSIGVAYVASKLTRISYDMCRLQVWSHHNNGHAFPRDPP